jgi:hypothetical protein
MHGREGRETMTKEWTRLPGGKIPAPSGSDITRGPYGKRLLGRLIIEAWEPEDCLKELD